MESIIYAKNCFLIPLYVSLELKRIQNQIFSTTTEGRPWKMTICKNEESLAKGKVLELMLATRPFYYQMGTIYLEVILINNYRLTGERT